MARIKVVYTIEQYKEVEIDDGHTLSEEEIRVLVEKAVAELLPGNETSSFWEWEVEPRAKGARMQPPPEWFVDTPFGRAATNGHCIIFENSPIILRTDSPWIDAPNHKVDIAGVLDQDFRSLPPHKGFFDLAFKPFRELKGLRVLGDGPESLAYLIFQEDLIACLMPQRADTSASQFQF